MRETELLPSDFIAPFFVKEGIAEPVAIPSMPGHHQHTLDTLLGAVEEVAKAGVRAVILFGIPASKDGEGRGAFHPEGIIQRALRRLKAAFGEDLLLIADLCLCEYTDHGHCGVLRDGKVDNDRTLEIYARIAVSQAEAGADVVAPSGMMDGQVGAIRKALDEAGFAETLILAYAAKYASSFYGPFREAAEGAPRFGDRRPYQMDPGNAAEALREVRLDVEEGADLVMVKPALAYLDVLRKVKETFGLPTAAYNVSGEYAMVKAAAERGWVEPRLATLEILTSIKRAGADLILTYHALEASRWLQEGGW